MAQQPDSAGAERAPEPTVVGIGASAGGLDALKRFFSHVPSDSDLAFVVVVHLAPDHESHLAEILQSHAKIAVQQVGRTMPLEPNQVYLIPPNANLEAIGTHLRLSKLEERRQERAPIDHFFRTLARTHDGHGIGVILTGTGSDGALGIKAIKEKGGLAVVQDPAEAEYDGMPQSALATGLVDLVLPLEEIPAAVLRYARTEPRVPGLDEAAEPEPSDTALFREMFRHIRDRTGRDFTRYKHSTVSRRTARRMQITQIEELDSYVQLLTEEPDEVRALADDLLITVTNFFRDEEVFDRLAEEVIPQVFADRDPDDEVRLWVAGCATGEEAYSFAMLLLEETGRQESPPPFQVFATDLHEASLERARDGFYPGDIDADVGRERLRRFFDKEDGGYRIRKEVRERVIFAPHNLLGDPPFSRLDLIACRNLLIYLQRDIQQEVAELFHYAIRPGGFLVLGTSESLDRSELFVADDKRLGIYRRQNVPTPEPRLPVFPFSQHRLQTGAVPDKNVLERSPSFGHLHARMVERYAPPSLVVDGDDRAVHLSETVGRYLVHPGGEPTNHVFQLVRGDLGVDLRAALVEARQGHAVRTRPIATRIDGEVRQVVLDVRPAQGDFDRGLVLVLFDDQTGAQTGSAPGGGPDEVPQTVATAGEAGSERERELEEQLELTRQRLQALIEEYETGQEEMKASNEELQSSNEELRSTLEELETSKEELHSMNEELQTVNQENRHKVEELAQLSGDLQNFLAATHIATLFLDRNLRIMRFTPQIQELFNVRQADRGRPLSDLTHLLSYDEILEDATAVLEHLTPIEREVGDDQGRWYLTRVLPYRSAHDQIAGVVITFVDITRRKQAEQSRGESEERLASELAAMTRLHELVARLLISPDLGAALREVLGATIELMDAAMGNVQLYDPATDRLKIFTSQGFDDEFLEHFAEVEMGNVSACGRASISRQRVIIEDVTEDAAYEPHREIAARAGYRAVQSTPLVSRDDELLGVLSTHYHEPTRPSERDLRLLDLYARQATEFIEHVRAKEASELEARRKDEFLAMLGHELRNPLAPIFTAVTLLRDAEIAGTVDRRTHFLDMIDRQGRQLACLVDDLLDVSRITRGMIRLRKEVVDLGQIVQEALETHAPGIDELGQTTSLSLPEDEALVEGDPVRLRQVVGNLIHNASKYSPRDTTIEVRLAVDGDRVVVEVEDEGVGMSEDLQKHAFELFAQGDRSLARSEGGLGVGLTTVQRLVEMHRGTVAVASDGPGSGALFTVRLPLAAGDRAERTPEPAAQEPASGRRVLVVEDNVDAADGLCELLTRFGHECWVAHDGAAGLELFEQHQPEVVLLDIGLPRMDGFEVAQRIRQSSAGRTALVIALTGYGNESVVEQALDDLFDHHLLKPVDLAVIKKLLAEG